MLPLTILLATTQCVLRFGHLAVAEGHIDPDPEFYGTALRLRHNVLHDLGRDSDVTAIERIDYGFGC